MSQRPEDKILDQTVIAPGLVSRRVADIDVTEGLRALVLDDDSDDDPTPRPGSPIIIITPPSARLMVSQRPRQLSTQAIPTTPRPRLRRKVATAPAGSLHIYSGMRPQPPRRAISVRTARPSQTSTSRYRMRSMRTPFPQLSLLATPTSRSTISQRKSKKWSVGKVGRHNVWRAPLQPTKKFQLLSEALSDQPASFSEKTRVKETLKTKKMKALKTQFVGSPSQDPPGTPSSMVATPEELYGPAGSGRELSYATANLPGHRNSPWSGPPRRPKHFSLPLTPNAQQRASLKHRAAPDTVSSKRALYIPGPIQLEEKPLAPVQPFDRGSDSKVKRFSDMVALDSVVMFFEELGMWKPATEECLDRHWVEKKVNRQGATLRKAVPPVPPRPPIPSVPSGGSGLLSPTRASQLEDRSPASSPRSPGRQKGRLRQLLESSRKKL